MADQQGVGKMPGSRVPTPGESASGAAPGTGSGPRRSLGTCAGGALFARLRRQPSTRSRLELLVARLQLRNGWTVGELVTSVERMRGRKIVRSPLPEHVPVGLCGLWLARPDDDVVLHRRATDPVMERHVVAHEVAHMLLEHGRGASSPGELVTLLAGVDVGRGLGSSEPMVQGARGASAYDNDDEYEAELLATMILTGARREGTLWRDRRTPAF